MSLTRLAILVFAAAVLAGPWYTVDGYRVAVNAISELAAQGTQCAWIMRLGFIVLGTAIVADGLRSRRPHVVPFIAYGLFMAAAGLVAHRPIQPSMPYDRLADQLHSVAASLAGFAITIGLVWDGILAPSRVRRGVALATALLCVVMPLGMMYLPAYQGLIQRLMFAAVLAWLWFYYPPPGAATVSDTGSPLP
jgi:hypothetical protein